MIYDDKNAHQRKPYRVYTTELRTEARAVVCLVCFSAFAVSAYVGIERKKAEKCPKCGCFSGVEKYAMLMPRKDVLNGPEGYIVVPDDELQQFVREVNRAVYP